MTLVAAAAFGLLFGSFANVLVARVPKGEQWLLGSSRCPRCEHDLDWYDNVPLVSWLALRGRCRHCAAPISVRYLVVEVLVAALWVAVAWRFGLTFAAVALAYLALVTVALAFIDIDVRRLPDALVLPSYPIVGALLAGDALVETDGWPAVRALIGLAAMGGYYFALRLAWPRGMGAGDVKLAGVLGLMAGYLGWSHLSVALIAGPLVAGLLVAIPLLTKRLSLRSKVPYGPALIAGAWIGYLAGAEIGRGYLELVL